MWKVIMGPESAKITEFLIAASILLVLIGGIMSRPILIILSGIFLLYLIGNWLYERALGKKIRLKDTAHPIKLFPDEHYTLLIEFDNRSLFPYINGELHFNIGDAVTVQHQAASKSEIDHKYILPLSITGRGKSVLEVPIQAVQRGKSNITNIRYHFPHLFKFRQIQLSYLPFFKKEIMVYPKPLIVHGTAPYFQMAPGLHRTTVSPFENLEDRIGTRDYLYSDPFHRINWKASVKSQKLQINTYEKVMDASLVFIVNLASKDRMKINLHREKIEKIISYTTYLAQYTTEHQYPFELFINVRKSGQFPYLHIHEGEGNVHCTKVLETLARIHPYPITFSFEQMMYQIGLQLIHPKTIIIIGDIPEETRLIMKQWHTLHQIIQVQELHDEAILVPLSKRGATK